MPKYSDGLQQPPRDPPEWRLASLFEGMAGSDPVPLSSAICKTDDAGVTANGKQFAEFVLDIATNQIQVAKISPAQAAYILLFTAEGNEHSPNMPDACYRVMNKLCRELDLETLRHFAAYMYGLMHSLHKLPPTKASVVFRGVKLDLRSDYIEGQVVVWYAFTSCAINIDTLETAQFCGKDEPRTVFAIHLTQKRARELGDVSLHPEEKEVVLPPGTCLITRCIASLADNQYIIQMDEVEVEAGPQGAKDLAKLWLSFGGDDAEDDEARGYQQDIRRLQYRLAEAGNPHKIPLRFIDPFTFSVIQDPVKAQDGFIYDRVSITKYIHDLQVRGETLVSPSTKEEMGAMLKDKEEDDECCQLKHDIASAMRDFTLVRSSPAAPDDNKMQASIERLSHTFKVLDDLSDIFEQALDGWQPPQIVVTGRENTGKSSLMERLCMMPLFPKDKTICTRMATRVIVQRSSKILPPTVEVWDTKKKVLIGHPYIIAASTADQDVRKFMNDAIDKERASGDITGISLDHELRITVTSSTLPPLNMVDLPGMVAMPRETAERTKELVQRYITENQQRSMYMVAIPATESPRNAEVFGILEDHDLLRRTVGVLTKCDRLEDDEMELLKERLDNKDTEGNFPLEPHGYVGIMNKYPACGPEGSPSGSGFDRLSKQAEREHTWFKENGFTKEMASGLATVPALVAKITTMFDAYVQGTWVPDTLALLHQERVECRSQIAALGTPAGSGDLEGEELQHLVQEAIGHVKELVKSAGIQASDRFGKHVLRHLKSDIATLIPRSLKVPLSETDETLEGMCAPIIKRCSEAAANVDSEWDDHVSTALRQSTMPFRLDRFPRLVKELTVHLQTTRPTLRGDTISAIQDLLTEGLFEKTAILCGQTFDLDQSPPTMEITINVSELANRIVGILFRRYSLPDPTDGITAVVESVFDVHKNQVAKQEQETSHNQRLALLRRDDDISKAIEALTAQVEAEVDGVVAALWDKAACQTERRKLLDDAKISASSAYRRDCEASKCRMNSDTAWLPESKGGLHEWLCFEFDKLRTVEVIETSYSWMSSSRTTRYRVSYSVDGEEWTLLDASFEGNIDNNNPVKQNVLVPPIRAKCLKLHPIEYNHRPALKVEVLGR